MKKIVAFAVFLFVFSLLLYCKEDTAKTEIEKFYENPGKLIEKSYYDIDKLKGIEFKVLEIKNLVDQSIMYGLYMTSKDFDRRTYTSYLDEDEVETFLASMKIIQIKVKEPLTVQKEYIYGSKGNMKAGAFMNDSGKWNLFIELDKYRSGSNVFLKIDEIAGLIFILEKVQTKILSLK